MDRVPDITRDTISFRETFNLLEVHAVQRLHARQIFHIEGASGPIFERPAFNKSNYQKSQAYQEWRRLLDETKNLKNPD